MKRWLGLLTLFVFSNFAMLLVSQQTSYAPTSTEIIRKQHAENAEGIVLDQVVQNYFIGQQDQTGSYKIVEFGKDSFPVSRTQYALHNQDAFVLLTVRTNKTLEQVEELFSQIKIEGNVRYSTTIQEFSKDSFELRINFGSIKNRFTINFGNLPSITLRKMLPLQVQIAPESNKTEALLLSGHDETPSLLFVTNQQKYVSLRFSQPMVDRRIGTYLLDGLAGSWIDEQTLRLSLEKVGEKSINLRSLFALNGNYLPPTYENLFVSKVTEREWIDFANGKSAGFSPYDSFYDQLVFAPDHDKYVGIVSLRGWQGDPLSNTYGFVLEQAGKAPTMIESMFYSDVLQNHSPIQWIDNNQLLFASRNALYLYDCRTNTKKELYHNQFDKKNGVIHEVAYDPYKKKLYLLVSYHVDHREKAFYYVDKWVMDGVNGTFVEKSFFSNVFLAYKYQLQTLPITLKKAAQFWTKANMEEKQVVTVWQDNNGKELTVPGKILSLDAYGNAVLVKDRDSSGKSMENQYYWWGNGKKPRTIPAKSGTIQAFHSTLLAIDKGKYYLYDPKMRDWAETHFEGEEIYVPAQDSSSLYRRKKLP